MTGEQGRQSGRTVPDGLQLQPVGVCGFCGRAGHERGGGGQASQSLWRWVWQAARGVRRGERDALGAGRSVRLPGPDGCRRETGAVCAGAADVWFLRGVGRQFDLPGPAGACRGRGSGGACGADGGILPESALRGGLQAGGRDFRG